MPGQSPDRIVTAFVSGNFFEGLELKPEVGRLFLPTEGEVIGRDAVIVLGFDYWVSHFNGDPNIEGRTVTVDGRPFSIIGVAPRGFPGVQPFVKTAAFIPLSELPINGTPSDFMNNWQNRTVGVGARLRSGLTLKQANAELAIVSKQLMRQHPDFEKSLEIQAFPEPRLRINLGDPSTIYLMAGLFLALAIMVLLLACGNVANLVLVRGTARAREMAIRTALGAQRSRLVRQMVTESITLALLGGIAGVTLGMLSSSAVAHINARADIPLLLSFDFDWRIFLYSFAIALLAGIVVGIMPAVRMAKSNVNTVLHEGSRGVTAGRNWFRDGLVSLQIASSLVLLVMAVLFVQSLSAMQNTDLGFTPDHVMNFTVDANEIGSNEVQTRDLAENIMTRLHQVAGVECVSHASSVPFGYFNNGDTLIIDGAPPPPNASDWNANYNVISPEYFNVMGIDLLHGRNFTDADNSQGRDVAIVSESTAKKFWPGLDAIGHTFRIAGEKDRQLAIVGVARDAEFQLFGGARTHPYFYLPYAQHLKGNTLMVIQVRSHIPPQVLAATVEKAIHALAPQLPVFQVETMHEALYTLNGLLLFQIGATLAAIMGGLGMILAVIGLYGVISYSVSRRVHEIGLRMALGATRASIFRMIYRQSVLMIVSGLGFGLVLAFLAARGVESLVVVSVTEPLTYSLVGSILGLAAIGSCYLPARRAMSVEPIVALHQD
jgi:predicted permease